MTPFSPSADVSTCHHNTSALIVQYRRIGTAAIASAIDSGFHRPRENLPRRIRSSKHRKKSQMRTVPSSEHDANFLSSGQKLSGREEHMRVVVVGYDCTPVDAELGRRLHDTDAAEWLTVAYF